MTKDMVHVGPHMAAALYVFCLISLILAILLVFLPKYRDNLFERIGASVIAFATISIWYHVIDGVVIPRIFWMYGWGLAVMLVGMFYKVPWRRK